MESRWLKHFVCDILLNDVASHFGIEKPLCTIGKLDNPGISFLFAGKPALMLSEDFVRDAYNRGDIQSIIQVLTHEVGELKYRKTNVLLPGLSHTLAVALEKDTFGKYGELMRKSIIREHSKKWRMKDEEVVMEFIRNL